MASSKGRPTGSRHKPWEDALRVIAMRENSDGETDDAGKIKTNLYRLAEKTFTMAQNGEIGAILEIGNRLDGKAAQPLTGDDDGSPLIVQIVKLAS